jgi:EAL domain-containing protein (putative c-di-GMP-specific phosphodiesterase class I)/FixJ family two-component response regulator
MINDRALMQMSGTSPAFEHVDLLADVLDTARVVIVDDEPANVTLLERMLQSVGVPELHGVTDPRAAVRRCLDVNADLLLLDLHMPGHDGFAVLEELQTALPADSFLPVLVLTADVTTKVRDRALHAGATDFLTKPLDRIEVILRVRNLLQTRALYIDVQTRNATLTAELAHRRAEEHRAEQEHQAKQARIDAMLEHGTYHMVFQPVIDLATGHTVGAEALARFTSQPPRPPNEWFDEAHLVGRNLELEIAAVAAALDQFDQLPPEAFLAVNISPEAATSPQLAAVLQAVPPGRVVLELTEHTRIDDYAGLLSALAPLRAKGVRIAVDDAGAGYAGLHHVLRLEPDLVKLDIALIQDIDRDPAKRALATALVAFASETDATIVAEGIETADELATLQRLGITCGQGYHIARPGPLPLPTP